MGNFDLRRLYQLTPSRSPPYKFFMDNVCEVRCPLDSTRSYFRKHGQETRADIYARKARRGCGDKSDVDVDVDVVLHQGHKARIMILRLKETA